LKNAEKLDEVFKRLKSFYAGLNMGLPALSPVDMLVQTIISQNNTDVNTLKTFAKLKKRFKSWDELLAARDKELEELLKESGLYRSKTKYIKNALRKMKEDFADFTLSPLKKMRDEEARSWLLSIKGIGPKTAGVVLAFSLGKPSFPVDTHVQRVITRLGIVPEGTSREKVQKLLEATVAQRKQAIFHTLLINHGKSICKARKPLCLKCPLSDICPSKKLYYPKIE